MAKLKLSPKNRGYISSLQKTARENTLRAKLSESLYDTCSLLLRAVGKPQYMNEVLAKIGEVMQSDRAYIFEYIDTHTVHNTYEWCASGIIPQINKLGNVDMTQFGCWAMQLTKEQCLIINDVDSLPEEHSVTKCFLQKQQIHKLTIVPIFSRNKKLIAFLGVDNPRMSNSVFLNILSLSFSIAFDVITQNRDAHNRSSQVIQSLASLMFAIYRVNIQLNMFEVIKQPSLMDELIFEAVTYDDAIKNYIDKAVPSADKVYAKRIFDRNLLAKQLLANDGKYTAELRHIYKGQEVINRIHFITTDLEDGLPGTVTIAIENITETRRKELQTEQALRDAYNTAIRANTAKSEFLSHMSHDIRTPMNAIVGMNDIAINNIDNRERVLDCLSKISVSSRHLLTLINEVLDMSKIESGRMELIEQEIDLNVFLRQLLEIIRPDIDKKRHTLNVDVSGIKTEKVLGDPSRISQVLLNILSNAVKYTPAGGRIDISIREAECDIAGMSRFICVISDNGIGMSQEYVKQIFDPFSRAEDSRTSKVEGTGLGMSIANSIVNMMNGSIKVESRPGEGSCFTIELYLKAVCSQAEAAAREGVYGGMGSFTMSSGSPDTVNDYSDRHIIIAEDNDLNMEIAVEMLRPTGINIDCAVNGQEAVDLFLGSQEFYYDLILMDIQMPVLNGNFAATAIRNSGRPDACAVPIVAMTANAFMEDVVTAKIAGMNEYITKPFDSHQLMKCLNYWIAEQLAR